MGIGPIGQARQQGCFWEHSMTFYDILPWLSNIHEARLTDDFVSLFKDGIKKTQNTVNNDVIIKAQNKQERYYKGTEQAIFTKLEQNRHKWEPNNNKG